MSITKLKTFIVESVSEEKIKSVNIWQSYKQVGGCLVHFVFLTTTLLKDEQMHDTIHLFACNYPKYSLI